ncbi:MAG: L,D-transpeptidase family protein [Sphingomonadales bacterium]|jgi:L,D-peptidoglycan transpeptidase YkuD (ErfK/YbiS/YcfS/YnhG family)
MSDIFVHLQDKRLYCGAIQTTCSYGRGGWKDEADKREGDDATPLGVFPLREVYYRADRVEKPDTKLPVKALTPNDGWCDDVEDRRYNTFILHPYPASAEHLWREDHLYDLILVIGHNDTPVKSNYGSAIFIHVARVENDVFKPTRGCIALNKDILLQILKDLEPGSQVHIEA